MRSNDFGCWFGVWSFGPILNALGCALGSFVVDECHCCSEWGHFASTQGAQMGFTLSPRQFNDCYNPYVEKWNDSMRGDVFAQFHDTVDPIGQATHDLTLNTFMDDITKTTTFCAGTSAEDIEQKLNKNTHALTETAVELHSVQLEPGLLQM